VTCRTFIEFLSEYRSGELPESQRDEFDFHLTECAECVAYLKTYDKTIQLGRGAFMELEAGLPADVPDELIRAILAARRA
jgi:anti-sigma factor RsiW